MVWDKRRLQGSTVECLPVEVLEPGVRLDFGVSVKAESARRLSLDALIDEVRSLNGPTIGDLVTLDLDLARNYLVSDLTSALASVGSSTVHALVPNHPHGEVVSRYAVVLTAHNFGGHVAWSARGLTAVVRRPVTSDSEVSQT